jgi:DNA repair exonuclease SbcCD ATPase subunit
VLEDRNLTCRQCGKEFVFTKGEQDFYQRKELHPPSHCPECRTAKQSQRQNLTCNQCKTPLEKDDSIYCTACLASAHLESELEIRQKQKAIEDTQAKLKNIEARKERIEESLSEVQTKLQDSESRKVELEGSLSQKKQMLTELEKSLSQKEQMVAELENQIRSVSEELRKVNQFQADLQWVHPSIDEINKRLQSLESGQEKINNRMLQLVERMHELYNNSGMFETFKRAFKGNISERT